MKKKGKNVMGTKALVTNRKKYEGKYVATRSFKDKKAICSGSDPATVNSCAKEKGVKDPVVFYVSKKNKVHIY